MISIYVATETGNAELVADEFKEIFDSAKVDSRVVPIEDAQVGDLSSAEISIIVTSTFGEGELPAGAAKFVAALSQQAPDLTGVRFLAFGLGDSTYETFNNGIRVFSEALIERGASLVAETGFYDAASGADPGTVGADWLQGSTAFELLRSDRSIEISGSRI